MTDGIFFLKSSVPKGLPPDTIGVALDPVAAGFACGGIDPYCSTAYSQLWQHLGGSQGGVVEKLKAKYGIDGRVAFVSFSAGHGFMNPLLNQDSERAAIDTVVLLDSAFGSGLSGYVKAAQDAVAGKLQLVSITSDKGTTNALNNGDYAWRKFVMEPAQLQLSPSSPVPPMPAPSSGVSSAGALWYYRYTHQQLPHTSMHKLLPDIVQAHLSGGWSKRGLAGGWMYWALGIVTVAAGAWIWKNRPEKRLGCCS